MQVKVLVLSSLLFITPLAGYAQGIPTIDAASIVQLKMQLDEAKNMVSEAQAQWRQMERDFEAITGNDNIGRMLYEEDLFTYIPESGDWREKSGYDVTELAERYGLTSDDPVRQEEYERELSNMVAAERSYRAQTQRLANIEALMDRANEVDTPQQRQDLANAISIEQAALQVETNRMSAMQDTMERDSRLEEEAANNRMSRFFE